MELNRMSGCKRDRCRVETGKTETGKTETGKSEAGKTETGCGPAASGTMGLIDRYFDLLPVRERRNIVTLNEGNTPLIRANYLEHYLDLRCEIYLKCEGLNPTGSFKDRGMTVAVSKAKEDGAGAVVCASTGNTSASAAAYAARAGMQCAVIVPGKGIALGKLAQAVAYGATVIPIDGSFDDALRLVKELVTRHRMTLVNSVNPNRIEGQKTAAFEICEQLGEAPEFLAIPVGNAGNITAYWRGFSQHAERTPGTRLPKMLGFQAAGSAPIVDGRVVEHPETLASAIRIGNPASWQPALSAIGQSGGRIDKVTDEEILDAYRLLARKEGVFVEPASASSVAGVIKLTRAGYFQGGRVVCVLTGHGLKDPEIASKTGIVPPAISPCIGEVERVLCQ